MRLNSTVELSWGQSYSVARSKTAVLRSIPTRRLTPTPTGHRLGASVPQSPSCPLNRPYPLDDRRYNRRYNQPSSADCSADCSTDRLVGMAL